MKPALKPRLQLLASALSLLALLAAGFVVWFYFQMRGSLPPLDGTVSLSGLTAPVTIERDAQGTPTLRGTDRRDVARALGFAHAQDRFFQMDLLRRSAAGELSALFGKVALEADRLNRPHDFRVLAQKVLAAATPAQRALLEAYAMGVNDGLRSLAKKPFEYYVVRGEPQPWLPEDSILVIYAMALDLQDAWGNYEHTLSTLTDVFGTGVLDFFAPLQTPTDAALDGSTAPLAPIPNERLIDIRPLNTAATRAAPEPDSMRSWARPGPLLASTRSALGPDPVRTLSRPDPDLRPGSNAFALGGEHTRNGAGLLASDPHLNLRVPNVWYRAVMEWREGDQTRRLVGATLPGMPYLVIGSNGHVAWALTNSYVDTGDLVAVDVNTISRDFYRAPGHDELLEFEHRRHVIQVKGGDEVVVEKQWSVFGPIVGTNAKERPLAWHWTLHDPAAVNLEFAQLEAAENAEQAVNIARRSGIPPHNFVVADSAGQIAWTIVGRLPKRVGLDGRLPVSWLFGDRRWEGLRPPEEVPVVFSNGGRIWSGNQRMVGGPALALLGDGNYDTAPRAAQIRDRLATLENAAPQDLLAIQLDDRALFMERWQKLLVSTLSDSVVAQKKSRAKLRELAQQWSGRADVDSVSYRLARAFRTEVHGLVFPAIFAVCLERQEDFDWRSFNREGALWQMIEQKPAHLLNPQFTRWEDLLVAAADAVVEKIDDEGVALARATWGQRNTARIRHPLAAALPGWLTGWLNLPADPLPGDSHMPRVQSPNFGASMRLVVSPGHEDEGLFHMPGGASGHPLSPFYQAGHEAWVKGEPASLLPGSAAHTLTLQP